MSIRTESNQESMGEGARGTNPSKQLLTESLLRMASGGTPPHGYIFEGPGTVDKMSVAISYAMALLCPEMPGAGCGCCSICHKLSHGNHMDCTIVRPGKAENSKVTSVKDADIELLIVRLSKKPYEGSRNVGIIEGADTMTHRACNRLLKTLEEPPAGTILILLADNALALPQTIRSRCVIERIPVQTAGSVSVYLEEAREIIYLLLENAPFYRLKEAIDKLGLDKDRAIAFLDAMEEVYGEILRGQGSRRELFRKESVFQAIHHLESAKKDLRDNIGVRYAILGLLLKIGG